MKKYIYKCFLKRYGKDVSNSIKNMIKKEIEISKFPIDFDNDYFLYVFQIAFFEFCGIESYKIPFFINKMNHKNSPSNISFSQTKKIHNHSIEYIKKLLEDATPKI